MLCTTSVLQFLLLPPNATGKARDIIKLKPLGHSEMQNMYVDGFTVYTSVKVISNSQQMNETSITTYTMKHNKF